MDKQADMSEKAKSFGSKVVSSAGEALRHPVSGTAMAAGGMALAGHLTSKHLGDLMVRMLFINRSKAERDEIAAEFRKGGRFSYLLPVLGGVAGAALAQSRHIDLMPGKKMFSGQTFRSMTDPKYWRDNPDRLKMRTDRKGQPGWAERMLIKVPPFNKRGSFSSPFLQKTIPVLGSIQRIERDPFLSRWEKDKVESLIASSNNNMPGTVSPNRLTATAIKAGAGFLPAYAFGKLTGSLLGLPSQVTDRASMIGGIASGLRNTGII